MSTQPPVMHGSQKPRNPLAFPGHGAEFEEGMSMRDYYTAHAPPPPEWFPRAANVESKPYPGVPADWSEEWRANWQGWRDCLDDEDIPPEQLEAFKARHAEVSEIADDNERRQVQAQLDRMAAWAIAWADAVLKARGQ